MARIGVMISGCGYLDGAEIHESVCTLLALSRRGHEVVPIAPDIPQRGVTDHGSGEASSGEARNVAVEAARIFRAAPVKPSAAGKLDALVMPGGYGAALNLCDFGVKGPDCTVDPEVAALIREMVAAGKPVGAWCIAPALVAAALRGDPGVKLTIGNDKGTAAALRSMGVTHVECAVTDCVIDAEHKIVSTPAYMYDAKVHEVQEGIEKGVAALLDLL